MRDDMGMGEQEQLEMEKLCLIDVSAEDDSLIPSYSSSDTGEHHQHEEEEKEEKDHHLLPPPSSSSPASEMADDDVRESHLGSSECNVEMQDEDNNATSTNVNKEQSPPSKEFSQSKRTRKWVQGSLRKSLAWDKAFFTNEGVLNPEELSLLSRTLKGPKEQLLPNIEEEIRTSMESNGSLNADLALHDLEGRLFEQTQPITQNFEDQFDKAHTGNRPGGRKQNSKNEVYQTHYVADASNRTGRNNQNSKNEIDEKQSVVPARSKTGRSRNEMDVLQPKVSVEQHTSQKTKPLVTAKRSFVKKVVDSTPQKGSHFQASTSMAHKTTTVKNKDEHQKSSVKQQRSVSGNNESPPSLSFRKKISSVSKRVRDTLGKVLPANIAKASGHRSLSQNVHDDSYIRDRSSCSPNSPAAMSSASAKLSRCHSYMSFERFGNPVSEIRMEDPHGTNYTTFDLCANKDPSLYLTDDSSSTFYSSLSPESSLDGMSSLSSPTHSSKSMTNMSKLENVACQSQSTSAIDWSSSTVSRTTDVGQRTEVQKRLPIPCKAPLDHMHVPNKTCSVNSLTMDRQCSARSSQSRAYGSKPSGLRMPSPKIGFFDTANTSVQRIPSTLYVKSNGYSPDKSSLSYSGIPARPPRPSTRGQGNMMHGDFKPKPLGSHSVRPNVISGSPSFQPSYGHTLPHVPCTSPHLRPDALFESFIPSSPFQAFQPGLKSSSIVSNLHLLAEQRTGLSVKPQQDPIAQLSVLKQHSIDDCQKEAIVAEDTKEFIVNEEIKSKLHLQAYLPLANQYHPEGVSLMLGEESPCQLDFSGVNSTLQHVPQALVCKDVSVKYSNAMAVTVLGKISDQNVISIQPQNQKESSFSTDNEISSCNCDNRKELLPFENQIETENATNRDISSNLSLDLTPRSKSGYSYLVENDQKGVGCKASQADDQNGHLGKILGSRMSCNLLAKKEDSPSLRRPNSLNGTLVGLNMKLSNAVDCPVYDDALPDSEKDSKMMGDSVSLGLSMDYKSPDAYSESNIRGRIPLAVNCSQSNDLQDLQKQLKENSSKKDERRLTSSSVSSVLVDISGQDNCMPEEQNSDIPLNKNWRTKSMPSTGDEREDTENVVDSSSILEKGTSELLDKEMIHQDKELVQKSLPNTKNL